MATPEQEATQAIRPSQSTTDEASIALLNKRIERNEFRQAIVPTEANYAACAQLIEADKKAIAAIRG